MTTKRKYTRFQAGDRFGRLVILSHSGKSALCLCACGARKEISKTGMRQGLIVSCGCYQKERASQAVTTHGMTHTSTYMSWDAMIQRCTNKNHKKYQYYGGRGISVCEQWLNSFSQFYADMGDRPSGMTIDRWPDMNGNYEPSNCRWATHAEQQKNKRQTKRWVVNETEFKTLREASAALGVSAQTVLNWCSGFTAKNGAHCRPKDGCRVEQVLSFA